MSINKESLVRFLIARAERLEIKGESNTEVNTILSMVQKGFFDEETPAPKEKLGSCKWCGAATDNEFFCSEECDKEDEEYCKALQE